MLYEIFDIDKQISTDDIEQEKTVKNQDYEENIHKSSDEIVQIGDTI